MFYVNPIGQEVLHGEELKSFCAENDIRCYPEKEHLLIFTSESEWIVNVGRGQSLELLHRNTVGDRNGYHKQALKTNDLMTVLRYIANHDQYRALNPLPGTDKYRRYHALSHKRDMLTAAYDCWDVQLCDDEAGFRKMEKCRRKKHMTKKQKSEVGAVLALIDAVAAS